MDAPSGVGIRSIGIYLPPEVRLNTYWPAHIVEGWRKRSSEQRAPSPDVSKLGPGGKLALAGMRALADDPFQGARERRIAPAGMPASDMEAAAARDAIARAGIEPGEIDMILSFAAIPDLLNAPNSAVVHHKLGLRSECFTLSVDAACNAFQLQAALALQMIRAGRARFALLTQANNTSRVAPLEDPVSTVFGDAATAVVLGPVADGCGIIADVHLTKSTFNRSLGCGIPGKDWWEDGRIVLHSPNPVSAYRMLLGVADFGKEVIESALARAGLRADQVDFFACHQGTKWLRSATQECTGLGRARTLDSYEWAGNTSAANLPLVMGMAERDGLLRAGDIVATYSGGTGITYSSLVMRWGA